MVFKRCTEHILGRTNPNKYYV